MRERPILFSAAMVRAILEGRKTQTRRIVKDLSVVNEGGFIPVGHDLSRCPYGAPGDRLWGREAFRLPAQFDGHKPTNVKKNVKIWFEADGAPRTEGAPFGKLRPSLHLPRSRSRLLLDVTEVRIERLWDISEADAVAEGIARENTIVGANCHGGVHVEITADRYFFDDGDEEGYESGQDAYFALWAKINGQASLDSNPWVWVVTCPRAAEEARAA